ncbi:tRNA1(Val) (adenine(37)-N6)-methyltransferase [Lichenibacterium dinghuense]|uniref:tRNA1(Val) (adenine(37)-N6)-methyltransferase n=1 Tax=Lichenibacterium dinghuense TaxID=2895977 RepID=UPI001F019007|nr:methyltransferase [Lichenibacterium sp. 6Y81]
MPEPDRLLGGRLALLQAPAGHRAGTDAVLLAAAAAIAPGDAFVDVGAGVGTAGLALALRCPDACGLLLEADAAAADLARHNAALNGVGDRVAVVEADLFARAAERPAALRAEAASLVVTNPPFFAAGAVRASPNAARATAHVAGPRGHGDWLAAAAALLAPKGRLVMIHRPDALPALLAACDGRLGAVAVRPVLPREGADAHRILLAGIKGSRAPLRIGAPLVLHGSGGGFTAEAEAIHRGEALAAM